MAAVSSIFFTNSDQGSKSDGVTVTSTTTYYSKPFEMSRGPASIHLEWTETVASLTGTFTLWYSDKIGASLANDTDWVQDTTFPAPTVSGTGKVVISIADITALHVRLKYVNATGTGTMKGWAAVNRG